MAKTLPAVVCKFSDIFDDPDKVGQSEYRAIHDCIGDAIDINSYQWGLPTERDFPLERKHLKRILGMLEEFINQSLALREDIAQKLGNHAN